MKTIVSLREFHASDIKPRKLLGDFLERTETSIREDLVEAGLNGPVDCPGCGAHGSQPAFDRLGLTYHECPGCASIYVAERPDGDQLEAYYRDSDAATFWREEVLPASREERDEKLVDPRTRWVRTSLAEHAPDAQRLLDVSAEGQPLVASLLEAGTRIKEVTAAHPLADLDYGAAPDLDTVRLQPTGFVPDRLPGPVDAALALDALDRSPAPGRLLEALWDALAPGGLLFLTAPCASGLEVQLLREASPTFVPPDKLNVLSTEGLEALVEARDWTVLEFSTPGVFDLDIVRRHLETEEDDAAQRARFVEYLLEHRGERAHRDLQEYLQQHRLSSFARLLLRKPE